MKSVSIPVRKCHLIKAFCLTISCCFVPETIDASDWMFRRSYYSHQLPPDVAATSPKPESRSAYRRAVVPPGIAVRGGYRWNRIFLRSGQSTDTTIIREGWVQFR